MTGTSMTSAEGPDSLIASSGEVSDRMHLRTTALFVPRQPDEATSVPGLLSDGYTVSGTRDAISTGTLTFNTFTPTETESGVPLIPVTTTSTASESGASSASATSVPSASTSSLVPAVVGTTCGVLALVLLVVLFLNRRRYARLRKWKGTYYQGLCILLGVRLTFHAGPFMEKIVAQHDRISLFSGRTVPAASHICPGDNDQATLCTSNMTLVNSSEPSSFTLAKDVHDYPALGQHGASTLSEDDEPSSGRPCTNIPASARPRYSVGLAREESRACRAPHMLDQGIRSSLSKVDYGPSLRIHTEPSSPPPAYTTVTHP